MSLKFSANLGFLWKDLPLEQRINRAASCGFDAVEFHDDWQTADHDLLAEALDQGGLGLQCLNCAMGETFGLAALPENVSQARAAIDNAVAAAARIGAKAIHVTAGKVEPSAQSNAVYIENLRHAVNAATPHGIAVLIEPIAPIAVPNYFLSSLEQADAVIAQVPGVRLLFDCFHVAALGHGLEQAFNSRAGLVGHVQIAGIPARGEPSAGIVDYSALLPRFVAAGYGGAFGAEYRPTADVESGLGWMSALR